MNMQLNLVRIAIALFVALISASAHCADITSKTRPVFIVTSKLMNGHSTNENLNDFLNMKVEEFAAAFQEQFSSHGMQSELVKVVQGQNPTAMLTGKMQNVADHVAYVCQVYWKVDEKQEVNIQAVFLPATYQNGSVQFNSGGDQRFRERRFFLFSKGVITEVKMSDYAKNLYDDLKLDAVQ
jgi:hypothetical protein